MAGDEWRSMPRGRTPEEKWLEMAYSNKTWIAQVDGGHPRRRQDPGSRRSRI
ncbi:hypothetical protein [Nonomuraea solani]|uniref:hypothetical protein n=1 Tax=Nonomuraea solani TaxID=1144553 RepID=UPI00190E9B3F|nr:hypothetical protein [Nonomuraea solani]